MFFLGKSRSKFGKYVDKYLGYGGQERIREVSKVSRETLRKACNDPKYLPSNSIRTALTNAARKLTGQDIRADQFWDM